MKRTKVLSFFALLILFSIFTNVNAQNISVEAQIQILIKQIADLQAQIQAIQNSTNTQTLVEQTFYVGDRIQANTNLRVRSLPKSSSNIVTTELAGSTGSIRSEQKISDTEGNNWLFIDWSNGYSGWSVAGYISLVSRVTTNTSSIKTVRIPTVSNTVGQTSGTNNITPTTQNSSSVQTQNTNTSSSVTTSLGPTGVTISASPLWFNSASDRNLITISWNSSNSDYCMSAFPFIAPGRLASSGSTSFGPVKQTSSFSVTCFNALGSTNSGLVTVQVTDLPPPVVTLTANPSSFNSSSVGNYVSLSWSSNVGPGGYCGAPWAINGIGAGLPPSGTISNVGVSAYAGSAYIGQTTTYSITCYNSAGQSSTATATVNVASAVPPTVVFTASPTTVTSGQPISVSWSTSNATSCTLSDGRTFAQSNVGFTTTNMSLTQSGTVSVACYGATGLSATGSKAITVTN